MGNLRALKHLPKTLLVNPQREQLNPKYLAPATKKRQPQSQLPPPQPKVADVLRTISSCLKIISSDAKAIVRDENLKKKKLIVAVRSLLSTLTLGRSPQDADSKTMQKKSFPATEKVANSRSMTISCRNFFQYFALG
jgi:hypothetical protein